VQARRKSFRRLFSSYPGKDLTSAFTRRGLLKVMVRKSAAKNRVSLRSMALFALTTYILLAAGSLFLASQVGDSVLLSPLDPFGPQLTNALAVAVTSTVSLVTAMALSVRSTPSPYERCIYLLPVSNFTLNSVRVIPASIAFACLASLGAPLGGALIVRFAHAPMHVSSAIFVLFALEGLLVGICSALLMPKAVRTFPLVGCLGAVLYATANVNLVWHNAAVESVAFGKLAAIGFPALIADEVAVPSYYAVGLTAVSVVMFGGITLQILRRRRCVRLDARPSSAAPVVRSLTGPSLIVGELLRSLRMPGMSTLILSNYFFLAAICVVTYLTPSSRLLLFPQIAMIAVFSVASLAVSNRGYLASAVPLQLRAGADLRRWVVAVWLQPVILLAPGYAVAAIFLLSLSIPAEMLIFWVALVIFTCSVGLCLGFYVRLEKDSSVMLMGLSGGVVVAVSVIVSLFVDTEHTSASVIPLLLSSGVLFIASYLREAYSWKNRNALSVK
jgi:hypothetical protein